MWQSLSNNNIKALKFYPLTVMHFKKMTQQLNGNWILTLVKVHSEFRTYCFSLLKTLIAKTAYLLPHQTAWHRKTHLNLQLKHVTQACNRSDRCKKITLKNVSMNGRKRKIDHNEMSLNVSKQT